MLKTTFSEPLLVPNLEVDVETERKKLLANMIWHSQTNFVRDVCVRFGFFDGIVWISGMEYVNLGYDMTTFLEESCGLSAEDAKLVANGDYQVTCGDGVAELCFSGNTLDWGKYGLANELIGEGKEAMVDAALHLKLDLDSAADKYRGHYSCFKDFVTETWDEMYLEELPDHVHNFIDYDKIVEEWRHDYSYHEGHVFTA